ncbi:MAG: hypothetical protein ACT4PO_00685 [Actinomycetota bacterium]
MPKTLSLPERQDAQGTWHQVLKERCYWCGCSYLYAEDDRDLVWEPGERRQPGCSDDLCECHAAALIGERRE